MTAAWDDEPINLHDPRCAIWSTHDQPCTCRTPDGHTPTTADRLDRIHPVAGDYLGDTA